MNYFFLHFRYTLKKYNNKEIWFFGDIIPLALSIAGLFNPTKIINLINWYYLHFFKNLSLKIARAFAINKKLSIILKSENPILLF